MSLYDPDAVGNAAPYLRPDPVQLMEIRSAPYNAKTDVWVPYNETGYTKGELQSKDDKEAKVKRLVDGKVKKYPIDQVMTDGKSSLDDFFFGNFSA